MAAFAVEAEDLVPASQVGVDGEEALVQVLQGPVHALHHPSPSPSLPPPTPAAFAHRLGPVLAEEAAHHCHVEIRRLLQVVAKVGCL